jgi:iron complex outermembrane receptor protein
MSLVCLLWAQSPGTFTGKVVDKETGEPIANAIILIEETGDYTYTNNQGEFEISGMPAGKTVVQVTRLGYQTTYKEIEAGAASGIIFELVAQPLQVEDIMVIGEVENILLQSNVFEREIREKNPKDVGEFLKTQPGFGAIRRGGYAVDPVMRSFKYEQLNVQFDGGVKVSQACPNRMDPVTTHIQAEDLEKIEIIKGPYAVRFGQNMGGVINLVMKRPEPSQSFNIHAALEGGYESNGEGKRGRATLTASGAFYDIYFSGGSKDYGNYKNGGGLEVPSSFRVNDYSLKAGFRPWQNHRLQVSWRQSYARDVLHAALPMDSDKDDTNIWSLDYAARNIHSKILALTAKVYWSQVDHVMSNTRRPNYSMVQAISNVESQTTGGKFELGFNLSPKNLWYLGADVALLAKDGSRNRDVYMNPCNGMIFDPPMKVTDAIWQNSSLNNVGIFSEWRQTLTPKLMLVAGTRVDLITSEIKEPAPQFVAEYGDIGTQKETNFSANLSLNYRLDPTATLNLAAGRGVRSANLTERYINHMNVGLDPHEYVGNPFLKPEANQQVELSLQKRISQLEFKASVFYSEITDFISAAVDESLERLFMPCMEPKNAKRFQNIDRARQTGFEAQLSGRLYRSLSYRAGAGYTKAKNVDWNEPLPEIPPLQGELALRYTHRSGNYWGEVNSRLAAKQDRIAVSFGETATPGFTVFNFFAGFEPLRFLEFNLGILNIFDVRYYEHLNRRYKNMPENEILYEPGRNITFNVKLHY